MKNPAKMTRKAGVSELGRCFCGESAEEQPYTPGEYKETGLLVRG
jgi:hypothetical protein